MREQTDRQTDRHAHRNPQRAPWMPGLEQQKPRADGGLLFEDLRHLSQLLKAYTPQVYTVSQKKQDTKLLPITLLQIYQ